MVNRRVLIKNTLSPSDATPIKSTFKGNKSTLPSKPCLVCGKPMTWRKAWAKNWLEVKYCSDKCRRNKIQENT